MGPADQPAMRGDVRVSQPLTLAMIGGGHAHLHLIRHADRLRRSGIRPVLIAPGEFLYSGLASGVLSGAERVGANRLNVSAIAAAFQVEHHVTKAISVDLLTRCVRLRQGEDLPFDLVSLNVGSGIEDPLYLLQQPEVWGAKPLTDLISLRMRIEERAAAGASCPAIVVAGAGASGFEIAGALDGLCKRLFQRSNVTLVGRSIDARWAPRGASRALHARMKRRGILLKIGEVRGRIRSACELASGEWLMCDMLVLAIGLRGAELVGKLGLPLDASGRLRVTPSLNAPDDSRLFATGDCAAIQGYPRPAIGVFGVRAAPILLHNMCALAQGAGLSDYRPQRRWLSILDLGDGSGLAIRGALWSLSPAALLLKRWLDRSFLNGKQQAGSGRFGRPSDS